jgi:glutathione S-transferase
VPALEDGSFRMTEASAILKYLAEKFKLPSYPKDLQQRAKVNEMMDWINTGFYRDYGYGMVYPQRFPHHKRRSDEAHDATIAWGKEITIADYFGIGPVTAGERIGCDFSKYPNVARWIANIKKLSSWGKINEVFDGYAASLQDKIKGTAFVAV